MKTVQNYIKNVAKSIAFSAADTTKNLMPEVGTFAENNKEFFATSYSALKNPGAAAKKTIGNIQESKIFQAIDYGARNLVEDLKTGNFYNKERDMKDSGKLSGFDTDDWDDLSEFGIDADWEKNLGKAASENDTITKGDKQIIEAVNDSSEVSTKTTVNTIIKTSQMQMDNQRASTAILYQQNEKLMNGLHSDLNVVNTTLTGINNMLVTSMQNIDTNMANYFTEEIKLSQERNAILKEMLEMQRNQYKSAAEKEEETNNKRYKGHKARWSDISLSGGSINLNAYFDNVKKNIKDELNNSGFGMIFGGFGDDSNMLAAAMTSPLKSITELITNSIIPATVKEAAKEFSGTLSGAFGTAIARLSNAANDDESGILGILGRFLGVNTKVNKNIDTTRYEKGPVPWDGIARKALTDVIPTYLRQLVSILSGSPERVYDYNAGRWYDLHEGAKVLEDIHKNAVDRGVGSLRRTMQHGQEAITFNSKTDKEDFDKAWDEFWEYIYENNGQFDPNKTIEQNHIGYDYRIRKYYPILCTIWQESSKGVYTDTSGRRRTRSNYAEKMQLGGNVMNAKKGEEDDYREAEANGGLINAYSSGARGKEPSYNERTKQYNYTTILDVKDKDTGLSIFGYLNETLKMLEWQVEHWGGKKKGSGTRNSNNLESARNINTKTQVKRNADKTEYEAYAKEDRDYLEEIEAGYKKGEKFDYEKIIKGFEKQGKDKQDEESRRIAMAYIEFVNRHAADEYASEVNSYVNESGLTKLADQWYQTEIGLDEKQLKELEEGLKKDGVSPNKPAEGFMAKFIKTFKATGSATKAVASGSAEVVTNMLYMADQAVYNMFFKSEVRDKEGHEYSSFTEFLTGKFSNIFDDLQKKLKENFLDPIKDRLKKWFNENVKEDFVGTLKNAGKKTWRTFRDANIEVYSNLTDKAMQYAPEETKNKYNHKKRLRDNKIRNRKKREKVNDNLPNVIEAPENLEPYEEVTEYAYGTAGYFSGNTMLSKNEIVLNSDGARRVSGTGLYSINEPSIILNSSQAYDAGFTSVRGNPKADLSAERRMAHGMGLATNAEGTVTDKDINEYVKEAKNTAKNNKGGLLAGGVIGGTISTVLGLVGGPLVGAAVGAGTMLITRSDKFKDIIFGKTDENGERQGGLISKGVMDTVKKYAPDAMKFGLAGIIPGLILPFGPLGGMMIGAGVGILKNNENFMNKYFGENGLLHFTDKEKKTIMKLLPGAGKGAAVGGIASLLFSGIGILPAAAVGSVVGMMTTTDEFKEGILGRKINGIRVGGLLNGIKDTFKPLGDVFIDFGKRMRNLLDDGIVKPIKEFLVPAIHGLPKALGRIPGMINNAFGEKFGRSMSGMLADVIKGPVARVAKIALTPVRAAANVATVPFRGLGAVGNRMRRRQINTGNADYMTAEERVSWMEDHGYADEVRGIDRSLAGIGTEGGISVEQAKNLRSNLGKITTTKNQAFNAANKQWKAVEKYLDKYTTSNGGNISPKSKKAIRNALEKGDENKARELIRGAVIRGSKTTLSNNDIEKLYRGQEGSVGLDELMTNFISTNDIYQAVKDENDASRSERMAEIQKSFEKLGVKDFDATNVNSVRKYMKLLDTEITNRESGGEGINLDQDNNDQLHNIVDLMAKQIEVSEDIAAGNTEEYQQKSKKRAAEREQNRAKDAEFEANRTAKAKVNVGEDRFNSFDAKTQDVLTRTRKHGAATKFTRMAADERYSADVINAVSDYGYSQLLTKIMRLGFKITPEAAEMIAKMSEADVKVIDSFLDKNVSYIFDEHDITIDDLNFCLHNYSRREIFKQRCKILAKSSVSLAVGEAYDENAKTRFTSFESIFPKSPEEVRSLDKLLDKANKQIQESKIKPRSQIKVLEYGPIQSIKRFVQKRVDLLHLLKNENYRFTPDAEDYIYELTMRQAGKVGKFFNRYMKSFYGNGQHTFTIDDIKELQDCAANVMSSKQFKEQLKAVATSGATVEEYPTIRIIRDIDPNSLKDLKKKGKDRTGIGKFRNKYIRPVGRLLKRVIGFDIVGNLEKDGFEFRDDAKDHLNNMSMEKTRKAYKFFNKNVLSYYRGYEIKGDDIIYIYNHLYDRTAKEFKRRCKILSSNPEYRSRPPLSFKGVMALDAADIQRLKDENKARSRIGRITKPFRRLGKAIKRAFTRAHNPYKTWKAAGFYLNEDAQKFIDALEQEQINILNKFLTTIAARFFKDYTVEQSDLQFCLDNPNLSMAFNNRARILVNAGEQSSVTGGAPGKRFSALLSMSEETINNYKTKYQQRHLFGALLHNFRVKHSGSNGRIGQFGRRIFNAFNGNAQNDQNRTDNANYADWERTQSEARGYNPAPGDTVGTNGIGTTLIKGAFNGVKAVGKAAKNGLEAISNGINNLTGNSSSNAMTASNGGHLGLAGNAASVGVNGIKNIAAGVIDFGKGRIGKARTDSSGSIIPDTSDSKTKEYVDEIEQEKTTNEKLVEAQLATAEELKQSNDTDEYAKGGKKMSWIKLLLIGGLLWKSGILKKLYEGFIQPLWTNLIKPWITDKAIPWITNTFIPAVGNLLSEILPGIISGAIKAARNVIGFTLDFASGGNTTNVGASTTVDVSQYSDEGDSYFYDESGNKLSNEDVKSGNFTTIRNAQGTKGTVNYDDDGNVESVTFKDRSYRGSSYAQSAARAGVLSFAKGFAYEDTSKIVVKANEYGSKLLKNKNIISKAVGGVIKAATTAEKAGNAAGTAVRNSLVGDAVINWGEKAFAKVKQLLGNIFSSENSRVGKAFSKMASEYAPGAESQFLTTFETNMYSTFEQGTAMITKDAIEAEGRTFKSLLEDTPFLNIVFAVTYFLLGMDRAESILGVSEVGPGEAVIAGILNGVINIIPYINIIPGAHWIIKHIFQWFDKLRPNQEKTIAERQEEAEAEAEAYNEEYGTTYSTEEYLAKTKSISGKAVTKIGGWLKNGFTHAKNLITHPIETVKSDANKVTNRWQKIFPKLTNMLNAADEGDVDALDEVDEDEDEESATILSTIKSIIGPKAIINRAMNVMSAGTTISTKLFGTEEDENVVQKAKDGEISVFSADYWKISVDETKNGFGAVFSKAKSFMVRLINMPLAMVQGSFNNINNSIDTDFKDAFSEKFPNLAAFLDHPFKWIWNKITGNDDSEDVIEENETKKNNKDKSTSDSDESSKSTTSLALISPASDEDALQQRRSGELVNYVEEARKTDLANGIIVADDTYYYNTLDNGGWLGFRNQIKYQRGEIYSKDVETGGYNRVLQWGQYQQYRDGKIGAAWDPTFYYPAADNPHDIDLTEEGSSEDTNEDESGEGKYRRSKFGTGYVKQIDPSIKNLPFNIKGDHEKQTIGDSACGPAAAVNAVKAYYGRGSSELVSAANMAINGGYKEIDGGTYPEYFTDYFAQNGLGSTISTNRDNIADHIRSGQPTVLMGKDVRGTSNSNPFGTQSHYVTVTGLDGRGRAIVQDPESVYDNQLYDVDDLVSKTQLGISAYGRSKIGYGRKYPATNIINKINNSGKDHITVYGSGYARRHGMSGYSKYRRASAKGRNYIHTARSKFHSHARGKYGRSKINGGVGNGFIFITDAAGYYIKNILHDDYGQDIGGCYNKARGYDNFYTTFTTGTGAAYINNNADKHLAAVIMMGLYDTNDAGITNEYYKSWFDYLNNHSVSNDWDLDVYIVSVNPVVEPWDGIDARETNNSNIEFWNDQMEYLVNSSGSNNGRLHYIDTYNLIKDNYKFDTSKSTNDTTGPYKYGKYVTLFYDDDTNMAIADAIIDAVVETTGEDAVTTDSCSASTITDGIVTYLTNWVMNNTTAGAVWKTIIGGDYDDDEDDTTSSGEPEEYEDEDEPEEYEDEDEPEEYEDEDEPEEYEDEDESGEGKHRRSRFGRGKYGRSRKRRNKHGRGKRKYYASNIINKLNRAAKGKFGRSKYGRGKYGRGNAEKIWYALRNAGLTEQGAAGLMGNMEAESGLIPNNVENGYEDIIGYNDETYTAAVDNGTYKNFDTDQVGYGLCQWTWGSRKQNLHNYANNNNASIGDMAMQLGFLINELTNDFSSLLSALKTATNVTEASNQVLVQFENASDMSSSVKQERAAMGQAWYNALTGTSGEACEIGDVCDNLTGSSSSSNDTISGMTSIINEYLAGTVGNQVYKLLTGNSLVDEGSSSSTSSSTSSSSSNEGNGTASDIVDVAKKEVGVTETPENYVKYNDWFYGGTNQGGSDKPWCAAFVSWCANEAGSLNNAIGKTAGAKTEYDYIVEHGGKEVKGTDVVPGDIMYSSDNGTYSNISHIGIVTDTDTNNIYTVEGNSSDAVSARTYSRSCSTQLYTRPAYATETTKKTTTTTTSDDTNYSSEEESVSADTLGGNGFKPVSKYGTFKQGIYGTGQRIRVKDKNSSYYIEEHPVDRDLKIRMRQAGINYKPKYGRGLESGNTDNYTRLLEAVLKVLITIADNTDRLNTIVNLITNYIDLHSSDTDVADATKAQSLKSSLNGILGGMAGSNATNKLSNMADDIADGSIAAIINAMNAIASE